MIKYTIRRGPLGRTTREVKLTRRKAIRYFCLECCGWQYSEVRDCPSRLCPLYPYRLGRIDPQFVDAEEDAFEDDFSAEFEECTP